MNIDFKNLLKANKLVRGNDGYNVAFINGMYSFQWIILKSDINENRLWNSQQFICGDVRFVLQIENQEMLIFKFQVQKEIKVKLKIIIRNDNRIINISHLVSEKKSLFDERIDFKKYNETIRMEFQMNLIKNKTIDLDSGSLMLPSDNGKDNDFHQAKANFFFGLSSDKDSKRYNGLINLSSSSHLNSLIQCLFHCNIFRLLIYQIDTSKMENNSVLKQLQKLFSLLQLNNGPCSTKDLVSSLGWNDKRLTQRNDIFMFFNFFFRILNSELLKIKSDIIEQCFMGKFMYSTKNEDFIILNISTKGFSNLKDSFKSYLSSKQINNFDNKIRIELPLILNIHLNHENDKESLSKSTFEFPEILNFDEYVSKEDDSNNLSYELYAGIVYAGIATQGIFYSYISIQDEWYEFKDSIVKKVSKEKAINDNFGGETDQKVVKTNRASFLIYINSSEKSRIFQKVESSQIPENLRDIVKHIEMLKNEEIEKKKKRDNSVTIFALREKHIKLATAKHIRSINDIKTDVIEMDKNSTYYDLYENVCDGKNIRIWIFYKNSTGPNKIIPKVKTMNISNLVEGLAKKEMKIFIQEIKQNEPIEIDSNHFLLFIKFYFPYLRSPLQYIKSIDFNYNKPLINIFQEISEYIGISQKEDVRFFIDNEKSSNIPLIVQNDLSCIEQSIENASFLIIELVQPNKQIPDIEIIETNDDNNNEYNNLYNYYDYFESIFHKTVQTYYPFYDTYVYFELGSFNEINDIIGICKVPISLSLEKLKKFIGLVLGFDYNPEKDTLVLYKMNFLTKKPGNKLDQISLIQTNKEKGLDRIYYKFIPNVNESMFSTLDELHVQYSSDGIDIDYDEIIYVPKEIDCKGIFEEFEKYLGIKLKAHQFRYLMINSSNKIEAILMENEILQNKYNTFRIEAIPEDQLGGEIRLIQVITKDAQINHVPFLIGFKNGDIFLNLKKKIQKILKIDDLIIKQFVFQLKLFIGSATLHLNDTTIMNQMTNYKSEILVSRIKI